MRSETLMKVFNYFNMSWNLEKYIASKYKLYPPLTNSKDI